MTRHDDFTLPIERIASHGSAKTAGWTGLPPGVSMKDAVREVLDMIERSGYKIIGNEKTREGMFTLAKKPGKPSGFFVTLFEGNSRTGVAYKDLHEDMGPYAVGPSLRLLMKADPPVNEYAKEWREKALAHAGMRAQKFNPGDLVTVYGEPYVVEGPARQRGQYLVRHEQTDKVYRTKPVTMQRRASRGQGKTALGQATVEAFLAVASSKLTQYDAKLQAKQPNMYRLGHYLEALNKVRADVRSFLKRDDPEALDALRKALLTRFTSSGGKASLPPINAVLRQISDYLDSGKMPSLTRRASDKTAGDHPLDRDAIVYFGIATEDYNIEEDADNGDEFAQSLMNDGGRGLNKLEGDALRNLSRMFKTRIMNEGHDGSGELVCKLPVDSWEDIKKIDAVLSRHHIGGDDEIDTGVQYVVARDFRLYPDGISGRVF